MGSYNYLGFAETDPNALKTVNAMLHKYGTGVCSTRQEMGKDNGLFFPHLLDLYVSGSSLESV